MNFRNGKGTVPQNLAQLALFEAEKQQVETKYQFDNYWRPLIATQRKYINNPNKKK